MLIEDEVRAALREEVRRKYADKGETFMRIADVIIDWFGYMYPSDTWAVIERIAEVVGDERLD